MWLVFFRNFHANQQILHSEPESMATRQDWQLLFTDIFKSTNPDKYFALMFADVKRKVIRKLWNTEHLVSALKSAHENGYFGIHLIDGQWPSTVVESVVRQMVGNQLILSASYCKNHDQMSVFINPQYLNIPEDQYLDKCSIRESSGVPVYDLCFNYPLVPCSSTCSYERNNCVYVDTNDELEQTKGKI